MSSPSLRRPLVAAAIAALLLGACGGDDPVDTSDDTTAAPADATTAATLLTPEAGAALIEERSGALTIIDVRTPEEFASGHLIDAVNLDVQSASFADELAALDPDAAYVVYCRSGNRSAAAAAQMVERGFTEVYDLGGIQDWVAAGFETTT